MVLGGVLGFALGSAVALAQGCSWPSVLWRASVAAYVAGILLRWWGRIWLDGWKQILDEKAKAAAEAEEKEQSQPASYKS
jgi:hypothetical protein